MYTLTRRTNRLGTAQIIQPLAPPRQQRIRIPPRLEFLHGRLRRHQVSPVQSVPEAIYQVPKGPVSLVPRLSFQPVGQSGAIGQAAKLIERSR